MTRPVDLTGTDLPQLAERLTGWDSADDVHRFGVTDDFWARMRENMSYTPRRRSDDPRNLDAPVEPSLRPGEALGPTLTELAQARSPGTPVAWSHDTPEAYARRFAEREARFPDWPWHEGGGLVHVYS